MGGTITLDFDASILQYSSSSEGGFIPNADLWEYSIDNNNGSVVLDTAGLGTMGYASGEGRMMSVTFNTISTGSSNISFGTTNLFDKNSNPINHTKGGSSSVVVNE